MKQISFEESNDSGAEERGKTNSIAKYDKVWNSDVNILYKGPVSFSEDVNEKINYFRSIQKKSSTTKTKPKRVGNLKTREMETWSIKVTQSSISLDSVLRSGRTIGSREAFKNIKKHKKLISLDAVGSYYDGMNLIYILFYAFHSHSLFVTAYDISDKEFYQIVYLGSLYNDKTKDKFDDESVIYASAYTYQKNKLFWYIKGDKANLWVAEHNISTFLGKVSHYATFTGSRCVYNSEASLTSINGSAYLAGLGESNTDTFFSTGAYQDIHDMYLLTPRKYPIICFLGDDIYHIGGLVNKQDNLVEIHRINIPKNSRSTREYAPSQRRKLLRNTYAISDILDIDALDSVYCQLDNKVYIFDDNLFNNEEYLKYTLSTNQWQILRFCEDIKPEFIINSRVAVAVDEQLYFFLFGSDDGELSFKILHKM